MATVTVTWNGTRLDAADGSSSTTNIGGGAGAGGEPDILYQGSGGTPEDVSRKVGTSASGFWITFTNTDISTATGTYQVVLHKMAAGNWAAMDSQATPGGQARLGSGTTAYAQYDWLGGDNYPEKGGFVFLAVDPNISGYRDSTSGSPNFASFSHSAIVCDFNATSKSENAVQSAVDVGDGYTVTGGGGADPTSSYADISSFNSTLANRHAFFFALEGQEGAYGQYGTVVWGSSATAVDYQDGTAPTVFILDGFYPAGWAGIEDNVENASTVIAPVGGTFISRGNKTTTDTRAVYNAVGSAASASRTDQTFVNFAEYNCGSSFTYDTCSMQTEDLTHNTATLTNCTIKCTSAVNVAVCDDFTIADATDLTVVQDGLGHFVDLGTITTDTSLTWTVKTEGFPNGAAADPATTTSNGDETILVSVNSGQKLTINIATGASVPSVKNDGAGDVAIVVPQATVTFENLSVGGEFRIYDDDGDANDITLGTDREGTETLLLSSYTLNHSNSEAGNIIYAQLIHEGVIEEEVKKVTLAANNQTIPFSSIPEENV